MRSRPPETREATLPLPPLLPVTGRIVRPEQRAANNKTHNRMVNKLNLHHEKAFNAKTYRIRADQNSEN